MTLEVEEFFDNRTLAALRSLRRDRKLTIGAGVRAWGVPAEDSGVELTHFIALHRPRPQARPLRELCAGGRAHEALVAMLHPGEPGRPRLRRAQFCTMAWVEVPDPCQRRPGRTLMRPARQQTTLKRVLAQGSRQAAGACSSCRRYPSVRRAYRRRDGRWRYPLA